MAVRLQRRDGDGDGAGGRDEAEGGDGWKVEVVEGEAGGGGADEGSGRRSAERGRPMKLITERRAVSMNRGADSASIRVECCVSVVAVDATR